MSAVFDEVAPEPKEKSMTIACRIDDILVSSTGVVTVNKTNGYPLPAEPGPDAVEYPNKAALIQAIANAEELLNGIAHLIALSRFVKVDPTLANPAAAKGHGIVYDLTGIAAVSQNI